MVAVNQQPSLSTMPVGCVEMVGVTAAIGFSSVV